MGQKRRLQHLPNHFAFDRASRPNAFVETGVGTQSVSSASTDMEVDKYRQLTGAA
ncbi:hypothetical protein LZD49_33985 [Dyadobacter sp. CY261]|uniref:hypothetical protein n=1 Tax=Dyadobacter sp. CY261 TaxID=2907203 RepID=UPI001F39DC8D|nr:hypothetical protein [Dyadobacter sp. CY261]MCF0075535.1 hypothetical protein [Dyadobacter sp. CY261]